MDPKAKRRAFLRHTPPDRTAELADLAKDTELLTTRDVANVLGLSSYRVSELLRNGLLPGFHLGKVWFIRKVTLAAFIRRLEDAGPAYRLPVRRTTSTPRPDCE